MVGLGSVGDAVEWVRCVGLELAELAELAGWFEGVVLVIAMVVPFETVGQQQNIVKLVDCTAPDFVTLGVGLGLGLVPEDLVSERQNCCSSLGPLKLV